MRKKTTSDSSTKPNQGWLELTEELVRLRAYQFYLERGCEHGHDIEDWFRAEAEIVGRKPTAATDTEPAERKTRAVAA